MNKYVLSLMSVVLLVSGCELKDAPECKNGATRCINENIKDTCVGDLWMNTTPCENQRCEMQDGEAVCVNICEVGDKKCDGSVLVECTAEHQWQDKLNGTECTGSEQCVSMSSKSGKGVSACLDPHNREQIIQILIENDVECTDDLLFCGDDNVLYHCDSNELKEVKNCGLQVCDMQESGILGCVDVCQPGETMCEGNNLLTCTKRKVFDRGVPCEEGTICSIDKRGDSMCMEKTQSVVLCTADKCVDQTLYRCVDGLWDNGTACVNGCGAVSEGAVGCFTETPCKPGSMACEDNTPKTCVNGKWVKDGQSCGEEARCMVFDRKASCECESGFSYHSETQRCEMTCVPGCHDGKLTMCAEDGTVGIRPCSYGCNDEGTACVECQAGCSTDKKTQIECTDEKTMTMTACPYGCNEETGLCNACVPGCSADGLSQLECMDNGHTLTVPCTQYGWKHGICIEGQCSYQECRDGFELDGNGECIQVVTPACMNGQVSVDHKGLCSVPIKTADDLIALRDSMLLSHAQDQTGVVYVIMNDIDLGEQPDWKGIGSADNPFSGVMLGYLPDVTRSGTLNCETDNCGFFGVTKNAKIQDIHFNLKFEGSSGKSQGRISGRCYDTIFEDLTVDGDANANMSVFGGVCGRAENSTFDHLHVLGTITAPNVNYGPVGGLTAESTGCSYIDTLCEVRFKSDCDRTAGFSGLAANAKFENDAYIGVIEGLTDSTLARVGGFVGDNTTSGATIDISNSRVVMKLDARDAVGGFVGYNQGSTCSIYNSLVLGLIAGSNGVSAFSGMGSNYVFNNVYSVSKVTSNKGAMQFCSGSSGKLTNGYYDESANSPEAVETGCSSPTGIDTIFYTNQYPNLLDSTLFRRLNENIESCSTETIKCNTWSDNLLVDVSNINNVKAFYAPWPNERMLSGEKEAIEKLNKELASK